MNTVMIMISLLSEAFLYLSTFGLGLIEESWISVVRFLTILLLSGWLCVRMRHQKGILKYLPLVLLVLMIVPAETFHVSLVLPAGILIFRCVFGFWEFNYDTAMAHLKAGSLLYLLLSIFFTLGIGSYYFDHSLPWFVLFLMAHVFMLRILRDENVSLLDRRYVLLNAGVCIASGLLVIVLFLPQMQNVYLFIVRSIYGYLIQPALHGFGRLIYYVLYAGSVFVQWLAGFFNIHIEPAVPDMEIGDAGEEMSFIDGEDGMAASGELFWQIAAAVLLVLAVLWIIRMMRKAGEHAPSADLRVIRSSAGPVQRKKRTRTASSVRASYRKYLKACAKKNIPCDGSAASDQIAFETDKLLKDESGRKLRELWLPVRYGEKPDENVQEVKSLVQMIRSRFRSV